VTDDARGRAGRDHVGPGDRAVLLDVAERSAAEGLANHRPLDPTSELHQGLLAEPGASFVTLRRDGRLLGCIGTLEARRSLVSDVAANSYAAAFDDPRLPPLTIDDYEQAEIKVSVLTPTEPIDAGSRDELAAAVCPGIDGIIIEAPGHRATFLPSVWDQLGDPEDFLDQLWAKAGLRSRRWPKGMRVERYRTEEFGSAPPRSYPPATVTQANG
jgi:AmmeMemoRadiSam system protein A